jgi:hypothetical protein
MIYNLDFLLYFAWLILCLGAWEGEEFSSPSGYEYPVSLS